MSVVRRIRTNMQNRAPDRRYPTVFLLQQGEATDNDVRRVAQAIAGFAERAMAAFDTGVDDQLYLNLRDNPEPLLQYRGLTDTDREYIRGQIAAYLSLYEGIMDTGSFPDPKHHNRYDYYLAKTILRVPLPEPEGLLILDGDPEFERLLPPLETRWQAERAVSTGFLSK